MSDLNITDTQSQFDLLADNAAAAEIAPAGKEASHRGWAWAVARSRRLQRERIAILPQLQPLRDTVAGHTSAEVPRPAERVLPPLVAGLVPAASVVLAGAGLPAATAVAVMGGLVVGLAHETVWRVWRAREQSTGHDGLGMAMTPVLTILGGLIGLGGALSGRTTGWLARGPEAWWIGLCAVVGALTFAFVATAMHRRWRAQTEAAVVRREQCVEVARLEAALSEVDSELVGLARAMTLGVGGAHRTVSPLTNAGAEAFRPSMLVH